MMTLHDWGLQHGSDKATHHRYCGFYQAHLNDPKVILEFGILNGASLKMWRDFYKGSLVIGMDIDYKPPIEGCLTYKFSATDPEAMAALTSVIPEYDLIIDDASHNTADQIFSFNLWWPKVKQGGRYIIEDIHASFYTQYNPGNISIEQWIENRGIPFKYFWRNPLDKSDSGTVIFFKDEPTK